jgi:hypothetical protein
VASLDEPDYGDERDSIRDRAKAADIKYVHAYSTEDEDNDKPVVLILFFNDSIGPRSVSIDAASASAFNALSFEDLSIVGQYRSLYDKRANTLEVVLVSTGRGAATLIRDLYKLPGIENTRYEDVTPPGVEVSTKVVSMSDVDAHEFAELPVDLNRLPSWRLPIADAPAGMDVELSPLSEKLRAFAGNSSVGSQISLKIKGIKNTNPAVLADEMETIAASILFELDVRFGLSLSLQYRQNGLPGRKPGTLKPGDEPIRFPSIRYPKAPATLYAYGKAAVGSPLLQYLAYYQAIEHFFPTFVNRDALNRVRNTLRHPQFNREADADIQRLIQQAGRGAGRGPKEPEQLKTTLDYSIERQDVEAWLETLHEDVKNFLLTSTDLAGVKPLSLAPNDKRRLSDQIAERVYKLRCRIVHAKDSDDYVEPLLPYSAEASRLRADLLLIEFLAQKAIIAGSNETF